MRECSKSCKLERWYSLRERNHNLYVLFSNMNEIQDPREYLATHYSDGSISLPRRKAPSSSGVGESFLATANTGSTAQSATAGTTPSPTKRSVDDHTIKVVRRVIQDDRLNRQQREQLASSILKGEYDFSKFEKSTARWANVKEEDADDINVLVDKSSANLRRAGRPIELVSRRAPVRVQTAAQICEDDKFQKVSRENHKYMTYTWSNQFFPTTTEYYVPEARKQSEKEIMSDFLTTMNKAVQKWKQESVQKGREESKRLRGMATELKVKAAESNAKAKEFRSRLDLFRKMIQVSQCCKGMIM